MRHSKRFKTMVRQVCTYLPEKDIARLEAIARSRRVSVNVLLADWALEQLQIAEAQLPKQKSNRAA